MKRILLIYKNVRQIISYMGRKQVSAIAASGAFWFFLSLVPIVILTVSLLPYTSVSQQQLMDAVMYVVPESMLTLLESIIGDVYSGSKTVLSISLIVTAWSAAQGFSTLIRGLEIVYEQDDRAGYFQRRLRGIAYMVLLLASIILTIVLMGLGRVILDMLAGFWPPLEGLFRFMAHLRFIPVIVFLTAAFGVIYRWGPTLQQPLSAQLPGAFVAAVGWILFSWLFSAYVRTTGGYGTYGSLSTVVAVMLWMYYCMYILLWGAFLNVAISRREK